MLPELSCYCIIVISVWPILSLLPIALHRLLLLLAASSALDGLWGLSLLPPNTFELTLLKMASACKQQLACNPVREGVLYDRQREAICPDLCVLFARSYSLPVRDRTGRKWEFVIKSWANGTENRRVYVLEQTGEFLKVHTRFHTTANVSYSSSLPL